MMKKGRGGDEKIMRLVLNYVEGMPKQAIDLTSGGQSFLPSPEEKTRIDQAFKQLE